MDTAIFASIAILSTPDIARHGQEGQIPCRDVCCLILAITASEAGEKEWAYVQHHEG